MTTLDMFRTYWLRLDTEIPEDPVGTKIEVRILPTDAQRLRQMGTHRIEPHPHSDGHFLVAPIERLARA